MAIGNWGNAKPSLEIIIIKFITHKTRLKVCACNITIAMNCGQHGAGHGECSVRLLHRRATAPPTTYGDAGVRNDERKFCV